jgi:hypothetical protein
VLRRPLLSTRFYQILISYRREPIQKPYLAFSLSEPCLLFPRFASLSFCPLFGIRKPSFLYPFSVTLLLRRYSLRSLSQRYDSSLKIILSLSLSRISISVKWSILCESHRIARVGVICVLRSFNGFEIHSLEFINNRAFIK